MTPIFENAHVKLVGEDGNAFSILGRCQRVARRAGYSKQEFDVFYKEATSGDYDHLLRTVCKYFHHDTEECNDY